MQARLTCWRRSSSCTLRKGIIKASGEGEEERQQAMTRTLTVTIWREGSGYVSLCPELDIASQGDTVEDARANLQEAVDIFFEAADPSELEQRLNSEVYVTSLEVNRGEAA